jgi:hypothetical protein
MKSKILISGIVLILLAGLCLSQNTGYRKSWALIVGINEYQSLPRLSGAVKSAKMIREKLVREFGFDPENVIELYDDQATRENILKAFDKLMDTRRVAKDDRVFIYFGGHGITRAVAGKDKGYIMPVDGVMDKYASSAISTDQLHEFQEAIPAKHVFFAMDACYSGTIFTRGIGLKGEIFTSKSEAILKFTSRKARIAITAGSKDEQVVDLSDQGISVFSFYFLKGLDGEADVDGDGIITGSELADYVSKNVRFRAPQTPQFGKLPGDEDGEFIFVKTSAKIAEQKEQPAPVIIQPGKPKEEPKPLPRVVERKPAEKEKRETVVSQTRYGNLWVYVLLGGNANFHSIKQETGFGSEEVFESTDGGGASVGAGLQYFFNENIALSVNLFLDQKYGNWKMKPFSGVISEGDVSLWVDFGPDINYDPKIAYFVVNPMFNYYFGKFYLTAGVSIGFVSESKYNFKAGYRAYDGYGNFIGAGTYEESDEIKDTQFRLGLPVGVGFDFLKFSNFKLFAEAKYDLGITQVTKNDDWKVSSFQLMLGLRMGL